MLPEKCNEPVYRVGFTPEGRKTCLVFGCGSLSCAACQQRWARRVKWKIAEGIARYPGEYRFLTLTFRGGNATPERAARCWRLFRRAMAPTQWRFYRVFESHKSGGVHIHVITDCPLPIVKRPGKTESIQNYLRRQSCSAALFLEFIQRYGFGPIADCQRVYGSSGGAASYMAKYLSKESKTLSRPNGRRIRVAEGSRNWLPGITPMPTYSVSCMRPAMNKVEKDLASNQPPPDNLKSRAQRQRENEITWSKTIPYGNFNKDLTISRLIGIDRAIANAYNRIISRGNTGLEGKHYDYEAQETDYSRLELLQSQRRDAVSSIRALGNLLPLGLIRKLAKRWNLECIMPDAEPPAKIYSVLDHSGSSLMRTLQGPSKYTTDFQGKRVWHAESLLRNARERAQSRTSRTHSSPILPRNVSGHGKQMSMTLGAGSV